MKITKEKKKIYIITDEAEKWITRLSKDTITFESGLEASKQRQKQKFEILVSCPDFIETVDSIRKTFNIPAEGFTNNEQCLKWAKNLYKDENRKKSFNNIIKSIYPDKIGARWYPAIEYFILFNRSDADHLFPNQVSFGIINDNGEFILKLEIYKDTVLEDVEKIWPIIKKCRGIIGKINKMKIKSDHKDRKFKNVIHTIYDNRLIKIQEWEVKRFGDYKNFLQYKKAFILRKAGKSYKEIAVELGWNKEDWPKVGTYIKRFKKAIKENILF